MVSHTILYLSLLAQLASAHFELKYPQWRGDAFIPPASEYIFPCANVNSTGEASNRTLWPPTGGSLVIDFHHPFTYVWMNLGLGTNTSTFNISLNDMPFNETGNGTLCLPHLDIPTDLDLPLEDGTNATLQVITVGEGGTALYSCADITFSKNVTLLAAGSGMCKNDTGVSISTLNQEFNGTTPSTASNASTATASAAATSATGMAGPRADIWNASLLAGMVSAVLAIMSFVI